MANHKNLASYSPMSENCIDYEAFSEVSEIAESHGLHCHDFFEFYFFFSGLPYYCVDDQVFPLKSCSLIIIPPFHLHGLIIGKDVPNYKRAWLYITPTMMQTIGMGIHDFSTFFKECAQNGKAFFNVSEEFADECRKIIEEIRDNINNNDKVTKWKNYLLIAQLLSRVYDVARSSGATSKPIIPNETMQAVLTYINNFYTEKISIPELSERFGISTSYLSRQFITYTGRSVYDYVLYRRILLAKEMICSNKPFTEIAYECGFNDYSGFLRAFMKLAGQTPSEYKKYTESIGNIITQPGFPS